MGAARRILVKVDASRGYGRGVLRGMAQFVSERPGFEVHAADIGEPVPRWWRPDAVIGIGRLLPGVVGGPVPTVMLGSSAPAGVARVCGDDMAIGRIGAEHLLSKGFMHLAYVGDGPRREGFLRACVAAGAHVSAMPDELLGQQGVAWQDEPKDISGWLAQLPRPIGLMTHHDRTARTLLMVCVRRGYHVPDEVAVLGVDNDELICELTTPKLSSVNQNLGLIGYTALQTAVAMIDGQDLDDRPILIPPRGVVARQSTDTLAVADADVRAAVRYIRAHYGRPLSIDDVADAIPAARRTLERRFRTSMGHSLHEELMRTRIAKARQDLLHSERTLQQIAASCGFNSLKHFHDTVRRRLHTTPGQLRRQHRMGGPPFQASIDAADGD